MIEIEFDDSENSPTVDIVKYMKCFDNIPSGTDARFSVMLCSDVPINKIPERSTNLTGSPGHTFLVITKSNGSQSISQAIGFYPQGGKSNLGLSPVPSKIVDDRNHEINASIKIDLTEYDFDLLRANAIAYSNRQYDLDEYNCTDYAVDVFNVVRPVTPIIVQPKLVDQAGPFLPFVSITIQRSPQMLYVALRQKKDGGDPDASKINITLDRSNKAPISHGPCY